MESPKHDSLRSAPTVYTERQVGRALQRAYLLKYMSAQVKAFDHRTLRSPIDVVGSVLHETRYIHGTSRLL